MNLLPFGSVTVCPACGRAIKDVEVKYSTDHVTPVGNGRFVSMQTHGDPLYPHLEKRCRCGYGWLEAVADPEGSGMTTPDGVWPRSCSLDGEWMTREELDRRLQAQGWKPDGIAWMHGEDTPTGETR